MKELLDFQNIITIFILQKCDGTAIINIIPKTNFGNAKLNKTKISTSETKRIWCEILSCWNKAIEMKRNGIKEKN